MTPMTWQLIKAVIILPGTALVYVPTALLWIHGWDMAQIDQPRLWIAVVLSLAGAAMAGWTMSLFRRIGRGTPAPWAPPQKLVVMGPYRYVRNPMITSVLVMLVAEALFFASWQLIGWMAVFFIANNIYFPLFEEKGLEKRFGDDYHTYKKNVPRWIPRLSPWTRP